MDYFWPFCPVFLGIFRNFCIKKFGSYQKIINFARDDYLPTSLSIS